MRICLIFLLLTALGFKAFAQQPDTLHVKHTKDSLSRVRDSLTSKPFKPKVKVTKTYHPDSLHSPHKAFIRSLIIPGWGHVYNHQWYYAPVYYTGFVLLGLAINYNLHYYHLYLNEAKFRQNGGTDPPSSEFYGSNYDATAFFNAASDNQRNFQLSVLGVVGVWAIDAVHAYINAKFIHSYSVDDNLSFKVTPELISNPVFAANYTPLIPGVKLTLAFK